MLNEINFLTESIKNKLTELSVEAGMYDPEHDKIHFDLLDTGVGFNVVIEKGIPIEYIDIDFYIGNPESCTVILDKEN
jgi:hypothetical protein